MFIQQIPPFDTLPKNTVQQLTKNIVITYVTAAQVLTDKPELRNTILLVKKGVLAKKAQVNNTEGTSETIEKYAEGDLCRQLILKDSSILVVEEDALIYCLKLDDILPLLIDHPAVLQFLTASHESRLKQTIITQHATEINASPLNNALIGDLISKKVATISEHETVVQAAEKMTELGYSSLVVVKDQNSSNVSDLGIITDRDIRVRYVAKSLPFTTRVSEIMTSKVYSIDTSSIAFDALIMMMDKNIHHLPVTENGQLYGVITITDLMHKEAQNAAHLISVIRRAKTIDELVNVGIMLPDVQLKMTKLGIAGLQIGKSISALSKALTIKLLELAQQELGDAPVPFAWFSAGSLARQEQLAYSDQDNGMIISDSVTPEQLDWFKQLADFVCDGLNLCGFVYCPGNVMASNEKWRQPLRVWREYFRAWIDTPSPQALLNSSIFFDLSFVYGDEHLIDDIKHYVVSKTTKSTLFLAHLSKNMQANRPPLGFIRDFVLISSGDNKSTMDLKHNAIAPIVDLARIYALALGVKETSTIERLKKVAECTSSRSQGNANGVNNNVVSHSSALSLIDAFEFLVQLKLSLYQKKSQQNVPVNNYLSPKDISRLERTHLKDAFKVIKTLQDARQAVL
jgi:CBS domain-containing protein